MTRPNECVRVCEWDRDVPARATITIKTSRTDCDNARRGLRNDRTTLPPSTHSPVPRFVSAIYNPRLRTERNKAAATSAISFLTLIIKECHN